jgi:hypothetical protein
MRTIYLAAWGEWPNQRSGTAPAKSPELGPVEQAVRGVVCLIAGHHWNHCTCCNCGRVREEDHVWVLVKGDSCKATCRLCGLPKGRHDWNGKGVCRCCGEHAEVGLMLGYPHNPRDPYATALTARLPWGGGAAPKVRA